MQTKSIFRQGDVLLIPAKAVPATAKAQGHLTLAYGEVTGHTHRLGAGAQATYFRPDDMPAGAIGGWLDVQSPADLVHEEHTTITLPAGLYRIAQQVEETPDAVRRVED